MIRGRQHSVSRAVTLYQLSKGGILSTAETQSTEKLAEGFTRTWRYKVGMFLIVGGHVILLIGLVLPFLGMRAQVSRAQ